MNASLKTMLRSPFIIGVGLVLLWFIVAFLIWPNAVLLRETFFPGGTFTTDAFDKLISSRRAMKALINSFLLAVILPITTNIVGVFIVLVTRYFDVRGARILWLGYATTFIYGGIVLAAGYKFIYGEHGIVTNALLNVIPGLEADWFSGFFAVLFVMTFATTTNHMLFLTGALDKIDMQTIESAKSMGASDWTILWRITLPMLRPMLFAVTILSFLTGLSALSAPQVLGGRDFQTISPIILTFSSSSVSRDIAALLSLVLGAATIILLAVLLKVEKGGTYFSVSKVSASLTRQKIRSPLANATVHIVAYALFAIYVLPVALIILYSFMSSAAIQTGTFSFANLTLDNYTRVLSTGDGLRPFVVSIVYSVLASVIVVGSLLFVAQIIQRYNNVFTTTFEYLLHIPWILPSTMMALGLILTYDRPNPLVGGAVLTGTTVILLISFIIIKIPFSLRMLKAAFASVNDSVEDAAKIMGASTFYTFRRVLFPIVLPTAAAITALNFNSLLDDYDTAVFLAHPLFQPLGLVIKANTDSAQSVDAAASTFVYTVILMLITGITMYLIYGRAARGTSRRIRRSANKSSPFPETMQPASTSAIPAATTAPTSAVQSEVDATKTSVERA